MIEASFKKKLTAATGQIELDVNFTLNQGEIVALYGKSGVGKTTILRIMAGLTNPDYGQISVKNDTWFSSDQKINLSPNSI